jgi:DNA-binding transcriptional regulator YhcF (GntR family)
MRFWISHASEVPIREQLVPQVVLAILSEDVKPGTRLPSTRELARRFRIHANTASAAYKDLEKSGWLELRHGSGVYIQKEPDAQLALREQNANVIYGTVRLIEKDEESFLPWAKDRYACIIFNLHVTHDAKGIEGAQRAFRTLIDLAIQREGSYYLTYHRWATREQVEHCYPQFREFLGKKLKYDPFEVSRVSSTGTTERCSRYS